MTAPAELLRFSALVGGYGGRALLPPVDLAVNRRQIWAFVGRNGGGKTTLLRTLTGLLPAVRGAVVRAPGLRVAYVGQRASTDPFMPARVIDIVAAGTDSGWSFLVPGFGARGRLRDVMDAVDVGSIRRHRFSDLSEGQKQRVLIGRALASRPDLLVLDEPTSAMDPVSEERIFDLIGTLAATHALGVVLSTHQMRLLPRVATHALLVDKDANLALPGGVRDVLSSPEFKGRYGFVMAEAFEAASA